MTNLEEEIIKCAVEGGWNKSSKYKLIDMYGGSVTFSFVDLDGNTNSIDWAMAELILDPNFWEAIGRAKGWEEEYFEKYGIETKFFFLGYAMEFMEINLTQGWQPAIEYLYSLISNGKN